MLTELRIAARSLAKSPGFALAAVVTLGLGVALVAAVLLVLNAYLFRTLPYPAAERLYSVRYSAPGQTPPPNLQTLDWRSLDDVVEHPIAWDLDVFSLIGAERTESVPGAWVTPGFVQGFGIQPAIGRGFDDDAFKPGGPNVALISDRLWRSRYAADPAIVGRQFNAYVSDRPDEAEAFTIIGVMPADFWHSEPLHGGAGAAAGSDLPLHGPAARGRAARRGGRSHHGARARGHARCRAPSGAPTWNPRTKPTSSGCGRSCDRSRSPPAWCCSSRSPTSRDSS